MYQVDRVQEYFDWDVDVKNCTNTTCPHVLYNYNLTEHVTKSKLFLAIDVVSTEYSTLQPCYRVRDYGA